MSMMFVLIHGGWHDGSCWDETISHLVAAGHRAHAPTMAGHGSEAGKPVNNAACVASVTDYIVERNLNDFVLVGHSIAGVVIPKVAELIPERVQRLVFQNAFVLRDGESVYDLMPPALQQRMVEERGDLPSAEISLDFETFHQVFINDADEATARAAHARLAPMTASLQFEKIEMRAFYELDIPTSFINFTDDVTMQAADWRWHPDMSGRLKNPRVIERPGSHEVCFSNPRVLAEALIEAAAP